MAALSTRSLVFGLICLTAGGVFADDGGRNEAKRRKDLGTEALDRGDAALALSEFKEAYRLYPSPNLQFNIALAESKLGHSIATAEAYRAFLAEALNAPADARNYATAELTRIARDLGQLVVHGPPDAEVRLDGALIGKTPFARAIFVLPGPHDLRAERSGNAPFLRSISAPPGAEIEVTLELTPISALTAPPKRTARDWARKHVAIPVLESVGVATLVAAIGTGVTALETHDYLRSHCPNQTCDPRYSSEVSRAKALSVSTDVLIGLGAAAVVTGVILLLVERRHSSRSAHILSSSAEISVQF